MKKDLDATHNSEPDWRPRGQSQLFLLRVWESDTPGQKDWPGMLQQTVTGERRYFRSSGELLRVLSEFMSRVRPGNLRDKVHSKVD